MLERRAAPDWLPGLALARQAYVDGQEPTTYRVQDPDDPPVLPAEERTPKWVRPRDAFALWVYVEVIHQDYRKQLRWERCGPVRQAALRAMAHDYVLMLLDQADFVTRLLRHGLAA
jgi:hypothetical protein